MKPVKVLGIHGVRNYQPGHTPESASALLARRWNTALRPRIPAGIDLGVAYYAHRLRLMAQGADDDAKLPVSARRDLLLWAELVAPEGPGAQGLPTALVRRAVSRVARRHGLDQDLTRKFAIGFFGEVNTYFTDPNRRAQVIGDVSSRIIEFSPSVVIAHSLGSVVAYETLWSQTYPNIDLLLTIGSPLAMPDVVLERLAPHDGPRGIPPSVRRWINVTDPGDLIAIPVGGIGAHFKGVTADLTDAIHAFKFHRVTEYLRCRTIAGILSAHLKPSTSG